MATTRTSSSAVEKYLTALTPANREALLALRKQILAVAPQATEAVSYGIIVFKAPKLLVGMGAAKQHLSLYLMSTRTADTVGDALEKHLRGKGTLRFTAARPLPPALVKKVVRARLIEISD